MDKKRGGVCERYDLCPEIIKVNSEAGWRENNVLVQEQEEPAENKLFLNLNYLSRFKKVW